MALKDGSSSGIGLLDLTHSWAAFEHMNSCKVVLSIQYEVQDGKWALVIRGEVWGNEKGSTEAKLLVCESVRCSPTEWLSLDVAAFRLLYALDAALAFKEMGGKRSGR